ncbi:MAG: DNA mismatch repair protein MutS [Clostridiales bacterium]|jgi:DNA mismatch repair protein MutS|nr:DNA mismatch repair protein MutS [Clostridiales bacterium]
MAALSPMMEQYMKIKSEYPYCLIFFRLGDFYEMFFDDAIIASRELELVLTGRDCGQEERAPMCGVPHHAAEGYVAKLIEKGYKVAICEQTEDPKTAKTIVKRDVVRVVTPGTIFDKNALESGRNNYITAVCDVNNRLGIAAADITTGELYAFSVTDKKERLADELARFAPAEILVPEGFRYSATLKEIFKTEPTVRERRDFNPSAAARLLCGHFGVASLDGFGFKDEAEAAAAAGGLFNYLKETQKNSLSHLSQLKLYDSGRHMSIDAASRRNLEICETMRDRKKQGSLLWVLDKTVSAAGARTLRRWLAEPLAGKDGIETRLDSVAEFKDNPFLRDELREILGGVGDVERLLGRVIYGSAGGHDMLALKRAAAALPRVKSLLSPCEAAMTRYFRDEMDELSDIYDLLDRAVSDDAPASPKDTGLIRPGYNKELDGYREARDNSASRILELEASERAETGIKNLKIKYNKVFGYYIEVTNSYQKLVPERYIRTQTLAGSERYATARLKELEGSILGAGEKIAELEAALFGAVTGKIAAQVARIQSQAGFLSALDALQSLAQAAADNNYCRPGINTGGVIAIKDGRHPVVERSLGNPFIPNDTLMNMDTDRLLTLTGPNMAGKSTYMRQVALIVLMAHVGSFVPAASADIAVTDKIFTRVGASDDLATGQSTFMVEMAEVSNILTNATARSLIILDEIGRGTSTYDGMAIAWSVLEYIASPKAVGAKTLFATHYHEMTELEGKIPGVVNYCVQVKESGEDIVFLHKIVKGGADRSYGIHVARLAGLPKPVIRRAMEIIVSLSSKTAKTEAEDEQPDHPEVVYYGTNRRKGPSGNRITVQQPDDGQLSLRDVFRNL